MNTMLSSEVWQDIQGYSGIYQVSTLGRIRSLKKGKIKLLKPSINNMGYAVLSLYANHKQKTYHVHKLVAETFLVKVDGKNYITISTVLKRIIELIIYVGVLQKRTLILTYQLLTESVQCVKRVEFLLINMI